MSHATQHAAPMPFAKRNTVLTNDLSELMEWTDAIRWARAAPKDRQVIVAGRSVGLFEFFTLDMLHDPSIDDATHVAMFRWFATAYREWTICSKSPHFSMSHTATVEHESKKRSRENEVA